MVAELGELETTKPILYRFIVNCRYEAFDRRGRKILDVLQMLKVSLFSTPIHPTNSIAKLQRLRYHYFGCSNGLGLISLRHDFQQVESVNVHFNSTELVLNALHRIVGERKLEL